MPTVLPRIQITQTPPVATALEVAAREWPDLPRAELIARLMTKGAESVSAARDARRQTRRRALEESRGTVDYPGDYLDDLRNEWPE